MIWAIPAAMAALGAIQGQKKNERAREIEDADRKLASATARYSPWTGMTPGQIRHAGSQFGDVFGGGLQGGTSGLMLGQQFGKASPAGVGGDMGAGMQPASLDQGMMSEQQMSPWEKMKKQSGQGSGTMFA